MFVHPQWWQSTWGKKKLWRHRAVPQSCQALPHINSSDVCLKKKKQQKQNVSLGKQAARQWDYSKSGLIMHVGVCAPDACLRHLFSRKSLDEVTFVASIKLPAFLQRSHYWTKSWTPAHTGVEPPGFLLRWTFFDLISHGDFIFPIFTYP